MSRELHLEERPATLKAVVGQTEAVAQLKSLSTGEEGIPHCLLFSGPSGCGKTTLARIVRRRLKCADADFAEVNAANSRGIDMVRNIQVRAGMAPIGGGAARVWLIDECHQLTADAQGAFLKLLEEPPDHVYFMLATTHPEKLRKAIRTRCTEIKVRDLTEAEVVALVQRVADDRGIEVGAEVVAKLAEVSEGSARKALVLFQQIMGIDDTEKQMASLQNVDAKAAAFEIARGLMAGAPWSKIAKIIKACDEEPESIRWLILSYFTTVALGGGKNAARAVEVMEEFQDNYFDTKRAGLVMSCYRASTN